MGAPKNNAASHVSCFFGANYLKIAIYHNLPSGGGKRALYEMTRRLSERHQVDVYTLTTAEHDFCDLRPFVERHNIFAFQPMGAVRRPFGRLNQGVRALDLLRLEVVQRQIAAQIDVTGYDLVFAHNCRFGQSPGLLKFLRMPSVYYCQEPPRLIYEARVERPYNQYSPSQQMGNIIDPFPHLYRSTLRRMDRNNVHAARLVLANSHYSRETIFHTYGIFAQVSRLGVDTELFRPIACEKDRRIVSVGAVTAKKGFDLVIRSLGTIEADRRPPLTIVSNAVNHSEQDFLEHLANGLAVQVEFCVAVSDKELVEHYNRAMLTLYLPVMEPFGFVPLESMACGTPVIGVREAGVRETVCRHDTGLLVDREPIQIGRTILRLLEQTEQLASMGLRGRKHVEAEWSWARSVHELEGHLMAVVGQGL